MASNNSDGKPLNIYDPVKPALNRVQKIGLVLISITVVFCSAQITERQFINVQWSDNVYFGIGIAIGLLAGAMVGKRRVVGALCGALCVLGSLWVTVGAIKWQGSDNTTLLIMAGLLGAIPGAGLYWGYAHLISHIPKPQERRSLMTNEDQNPESIERRPIIKDRQITGVYWGNFYSKKGIEMTGITGARWHYADVFIGLDSGALLCLSSEGLEPRETLPADAKPVERRGMPDVCRKARVRDVIVDDEASVIVLLNDGHYLESCLAPGGSNCVTGHLSEWDFSEEICEYKSLLTDRKISLEELRQLASPADRAPTTGGLA